MKFSGRRFLSFSCFTLVLGTLGLSEAYANYPTTSDGAVANGVTDDTANLQAALTYCSDHDLVCEIPAGKTHYVTGPLFIWGGASLRSSVGGGLKLDDSANNSLLINVGISGKVANETTTERAKLKPVFTGDISNVVFTMAGGANYGRILYFWRTDGAEISNNVFNLGNYRYSPTSSGNNNNWVINGTTTNCDTNVPPNCRLVRKNIEIINNRVVASADQLAFEGLAVDGFDGVLIKDNVVTGTGDDPVAVHFSKNVQILSNTLRSVDGRIYVSSSDGVEIADNTHIRIPSRLNGNFYSGVGLIYTGFEHPGVDNTGFAPQAPNDNFNIHDNRVYYPAGSIDTGGAISIFGPRHTIVSDNIMVNDATPSLSKFSMYIGSQIFQVFLRDVNGNLILDSKGKKQPLANVTAWNDPTPPVAPSTKALDAGFFGGFNHARTHEITLDGNTSGSTAGVGNDLSFVMIGICDSQVGPVTLTDNSAPAYERFFVIYRDECHKSIVTDPLHPNVTNSKSYDDTDSDGYPDMFDNCPSIANADQFDLDGNAVGDVCQHGLTAEYHDVSTLINDPVLTRIDPAIDFNWAFSSPGLDVPADYFSVHWTGRVVAPVTGTYQLCVLGDDGIRLWLDETLILDFWKPQDSVTNCASVALSAGQSAPIELNFFDHEEEAIVKLTWSYPGQATQVIPSSALYAR